MSLRRHWHLEWFKVKVRVLGPSWILEGSL
jgi:hypothetical protein